MNPDDPMPQSRFIAEPITVSFNTPLAMSKKPTCPDRFTWGRDTFEIAEMLAEWRDYGRRGRMARNMQPQHAAIAEQRGSWGVGRFYFKVRTTDGRVFELYYDRAPKDADNRQGNWYLFREWAS